MSEEPAWSAYQTAVDAAEAAWTATEAAAWTAYTTTNDTAWATYEAVEAAAWNSYMGAVAAADSTWIAVEAAAWAAYEISVATAEATANAALDAAWDALGTAEENVWAAYEATNNAAWASYEAAEAAASATWDATEAAAWAAHQAAISSAENGWTAAEATAYAAYEAADAAAWAACQAANDAAWAAFEAAVASANAAWDAAVAAAAATAEAAEDAAWAAYMAAEAAAWAAYQAAVNSAPGNQPSAGGVAGSNTVTDQALAEWAEENEDMFFVGDYEPRSLRDPNRDLAIGTAEDWTNYGATLYNKFLFDNTITLDPANPDWESAIEKLNNLKDGSLKQIVISGHGNSSKAGPFQLTDLTPGKGATRFLELLGKKAKEDTKIELRACQTCNKDSQAFIKEIAKLTKRPVIGYDDWYGPGPHGQQYIAKPDGTVETGKKYPPYKGNQKKSSSVDPNPRRPRPNRDF